MRRILLSLSLGAGLAFAGCGEDTSSAEPVDDAGQDAIVEDTPTDASEEATIDETSVDDSGSVEETGADSSAVDGASDETSAPDTLVADSYVADSSVPDTFAADTRVPDTSVPDTSVPDTYVADTYVPDTFVPDAGGTCETPPPVGSLGYSTLSTANFYTSGAGPTVRGCWVEYKPAYELWSDGLVKRRWIHLPAGTTIATGPNPVGGAFPNMDQWQFPVGTRFIKEFARSDGKKLETRLWERTATGYKFGSFKWRADQTDADYTESGGTAAFTLDDGTTAWDIPRRAECTKCHDGELGKGLGFSGVQLSKAPAFAGDVTLQSILAKGWLSHPPSTMPTSVGSPVPGTATESSAIGRLHSNCGHCHNPNGNANAVNMNLRATWGDATVSATKVWTTAVGVPSAGWSKMGITLRIDPGTSALGDGQPTKSAIWYRANARGNNDQMPPLGTSLPDTNGLSKALDSWIKTL